MARSNPSKRRKGKGRRNPARAGVATRTDAPLTSTYAFKGAVAVGAAGLGYLAWRRWYP